LLVAVSDWTLLLYQRHWPIFWPIRKGPGLDARLRSVCSSGKSSIVCHRIDRAIHHFARARHRGGLGVLGVTVRLMRVVVIGRMVSKTSPFVFLHSMISRAPGPRCFSARSMTRGVVCTEATKADEDTLLFDIPTDRYSLKDVPTTFAYPHCFEPHPIAKYAADEVRVFVDMTFCCVCCFYLTISPASVCCLGCRFQASLLAFCNQLQIIQSKRRRVRQNVRSTCVQDQ